MIASAWPTVRLGDHLEFLTSGSRGWSQYVRESGAMFLRIQNVGHNRLDLDDVAYVDPPPGAEAQRTRVQAGDVLLSITADLGRTAVVPAGLGPAHINQHLAILRVRNFDPRFVAAYIALGPGRYQLAKLDRLGVKSGLNFDDIRSLEIPLPPLPEQRRIADILDKADAIRRKRKEAITLTEALLRSAFLEMFGDPVRNPKGWPVKPLGDLADVNRGRFTPRPRNDPQYYGGPFPFIQTGDLSNASGYLRAWKQTLNEKGCAVSRGFSRGSIAIAIAANIGDTAIVDFDFWCPDSVVGIVARAAPAEYLEMHLRFQQTQLEAGAPETAQKNINLETLRPLAIMVPPGTRLQTYAALYQRCYSAITKHKAALAESDHLFSSLVDRAFRGELTAPSTSQKKQLDMFDALGGE